MWSHDFIHPPEVVGPRGRKTNFGGDQHRRRQEPFANTLLLGVQTARFVLS